MGTNEGEEGREREREGSKQNTGEIGKTTYVIEEICQAFCFGFQRSQTAQGAEKCEGETSSAASAFGRSSRAKPVATGSLQHLPVSYLVLI